MTDLSRLAQMLGQNGWIVPGPAGPEDDLLIEPGRTRDRMEDDTQKLIARVHDWMAEAMALRQQVHELTVQLEQSQVAAQESWRHYNAARDEQLVEIERRKLEAFKCRTEMRVVQGLLADALWDVEQLRAYIGSVE